MGSLELVFLGLAALLSVATWLIFGRGPRDNFSDVGLGMLICVSLNAVGYLLLAAVYLGIRLLFHG